MTTELEVNRPLFRFFAVVECACSPTTGKQIGSVLSYFPRDLDVDISILPQLCAITDPQKQSSFVFGVSSNRLHCVCVPVHTKTNANANNHNSTTNNNTNDDNCNSQSSNENPANDNSTNTNSTNDNNANPTNQQIFFVISSCDKSVWFCLRACASLLTCFVEQNPTESEFVGYVAKLLSTCIPISFNRSEISIPIPPLITGSQESPQQLKANIGGINSLSPGDGWFECVDWFSRASDSTILELFRAVLLEGRVVFVNAETSAECCSLVCCISEIAYPLEWGHAATFLPPSQLHLINAPCPFIFAVSHKFSEEALKKHSQNVAELQMAMAFSDDGDDGGLCRLVVVDYETTQVSVHGNFSPLPPLPNAVELTLIHRLYDFRKAHEAGSPDSALVLIHAFRSAMCCVLQNYTKHIILSALVAGGTTNSYEDTDVFDLESLMLEKDAKDHAFFQQLTVTQAFPQFLHTRHSLKVVSTRAAAQTTTGNTPTKKPSSGSNNISTQNGSNQDSKDGLVAFDALGGLNGWDLPTAVCLHPLFTGAKHCVASCDLTAPEYQVVVNKTLGCVVREDNKLLVELKTDAFPSLVLDTHRSLKQLPPVFLGYLRGLVTAFPFLTRNRLLKQHDITVKRDDFSSSFFERLETMGAVVNTQRESSAKTLFNSISEAIASAAPGAHILVRSGIYRENLVVNKSVLLIGQGMDRGDVIIESPNDRPAITVSNGNPTIRNMTIICSRTTANTTSNSLGDASAESMASPVHSPRSMHARGCALFVTSHASASVLDCNIESQGLGVHVHTHASVTMFDCVVRKCGETGVWVGPGGRLFARRCEMSQNKGCGVVVVLSSQGEMGDLSEDESGRVVVKQATQVVIASSQLNGNAGHGVEVRSEVADGSNYDERNVDQYGSGEWLSSFLRDFYAVHNTAKLESIEELTTFYKGREGRLDKNLREQYKSGLPHLTNQVQNVTPDVWPFVLTQIGDNDPPRQQNKTLEGETSTFWEAARMQLHKHAKQNQPSWDDKIAAGIDDLGINKLKEVTKDFTVASTKLAFKSTKMAKSLLSATPRAFMKPFSTNQKAPKNAPPQEAPNASNAESHTTGASNMTDPVNPISPSLQDGETVDQASAPQTPQAPAPQVPQTSPALSEHGTQLVKEQETIAATAQADDAKQTAESALGSPPPEHPTNVNNQPHEFDGKTHAEPHQQPKHAHSQAQAAGPPATLSPEQLQAEMSLGMWKPKQSDENQDNMLSATDAEELFGRGNAGLAAQSMASLITDASTDSIGTSDQNTTELQVLEGSKHVSLEFEGWFNNAMRVVVANCTVSNNKLDGVRVCNVGRVGLRKNRLIGNQNCGVTVMGPNSKVEVTANKIFQATRFGVTVARGGWAVVRGNMIQNCAAGGVGAKNGASALVVHNEIAGGNACVQLTYGAAGNLCGNILHNSEKDGVQVLRESSVAMRNNVIFGHKGCGVYVGMLAQSTVHQSNAVTDCDDALVWDMRTCVADPEPAK